jgi:hypothetical protein
MSWDRLKRVGALVVAGLAVEIGVAWWLLGRLLPDLQFTELATAVVAVNLALFAYWWLEMDMD